MFPVPGNESYTAEGIPADKLVLGLLWYGYVYKCLWSSPIDAVETP